MENYKQLADKGRAACVHSIDILNEIIKVKKILGQDYTAEKKRMGLMLEKFERINDACNRIEAIIRRIYRSFGQKRQ